MVTLWYTKVKLGLSDISEVPDRYLEQVNAKLAADNA
ncbi:hypothetical protein HNP81_002794 [Peribacillus huizhouensis]|uniref:XkdX family protein n=1 Tax=Peribacillus huizhouensis TaxID=1501239 RepID=A0ABR6CRC5_9BACI|nr:hypothetical protein [Peribacillus huizhouensis]